MFIELAEFLRCPEPHPQAHCVVLADRTVNRDVLEGVVGCPACQKSYPIQNGVVRFGNPPQPEQPVGLPDAAAVQALLGVTTAGGNVVLVGSAAEFASGPQPFVEGVHSVCINAFHSVADGATRSQLESATTIPLRDAMARGVVLGAEYAIEPWISEAARVLLPGLRLVGLRERLAVEGIDQMVNGQGMWVGQKKN